jgi:LPS O-antigen subunit length determinant protein (WzzB/FepE family)
MIVLIWLFLGGIVGTGMVFGKVYLKDIKEKWNEQK